MKIGYFADGPWSHKAIEKIVAMDGVEIVFITPRFDTQDPVLRQWAEKLDVPYLPHPKVNSDEFLALIEPFEADLLVSMSFNQILRKRIINFAPLGFINCHAGALPFYRGRNPLNWALINGEKAFGITVHMVDEGIDTGDIVVREMFDISEQDNYQTLLELAVTECANVLEKAVKQFRDKTVKTINQDTIHPVGTYFGIRTFGDELIDFQLSSERLFNFVRAITLPGPGARMFQGEQELAVIEAQLIPGAPDYIATCGEVVGRSSAGVVVKTGTSTLLISAMAKVDGKGAVGETFTPKQRIGTRFKSHTLQSKTGSTK